MYKFINLLIKITILSFLFFSNAKAVEPKVVLKLQDITSGCDFLFQSYFSKFISTHNNQKLFTLDKSVTGVSLSNTDSLDLTAQVKVKKGKATKSPTLTLFFAMERNKNIGNFIIPDARQKLCKGKFKMFNSSAKFAKSDSIKPTKINNIKKTIKQNRKEKLNISFLKTGGFFSGKYNYDKLEKITISENFPRYTARGYEACQSTKSKWNSTINFYLDENLFWATKWHSRGEWLRIYMGVRKKDKIIFRVIEGASKWRDTTDWLSGYTLDVKNKTIQQALSQKMTGSYVSSGGSYSRKCTINFDRVIKIRNLNDQFSKLTYLVRGQRIALNKMKELGMVFKQRYDFEKAEYIVERLYRIEELKLKKIKEQKLAELREKKAAEEREKIRQMKLEEERKKAKKESEERKKKLEKEKRKKLAEEKAKRIAEAKAKKLAEEKSKKLAEAKAKKLAEEKAKRIIEEKARKKAEAKAKKLEEEKAKLEEKLRKNKQAEEEKIRKEKEEQQRVLAEERAKKKAEEDAKKFAEQSEKKIKLKIKWARSTIKGDRRLHKSAEVLITKSKKHPSYQELLSLHNKMEDFVGKSVDEMSYEEVLDYEKTHPKFHGMVSKVYEDNKKLGIYAKEDDFVKSRNKMIRNLDDEFKDINQKITQFGNIYRSYKSKYKQLSVELDKNLEDYLLTRFDKEELKPKIETRMDKLKQSRNKKGNYWRNFFYEASVYVEDAKRFDETCKSWLKLAPAKFRSYYNQEIYNLNVDKSIKELEKKQKEDDDFFDKLGN